MEKSKHALVVDQLKATKWLSIKELVKEPILLEKYTEDQLWCLFSTDLLKAFLWIRSKHNAPITITSAFRYMRADLSGHNFGYSLDLKAKDMKKLREIAKLCPYLTEIEDESFTPTWVHISTRPSMIKGIRFISGNKSIKG